MRKGVFRGSRRRQIVKESLDDEDVSLEEEDEEPTPQSKPKQKSKKKQRPTKAKAKATTKASGGFDVDGPCKPGMKFNLEWSAGKKAVYHAARKRHHRTGTKEVLTDKVNGMKAVIKRWKATGASEEKIKELTKAMKKWEATLNEE